MKGEKTLAKVIAVTTNKGGVLKTSLVTNIAGVLSKSEQERQIILQALEEYKQTGKRMSSKLATMLSKSKTKGEGKRVLIVDTDSQANVSISFGIDNPEDTYEVTLLEVILEGIEPKKAIVNIHKNIDLLPSNMHLSKLTFIVLSNLEEYAKEKGVFYLLKDKIDSLRDEYDYILIDTPPDLGLISGNALVASDEILIPFQPESYSMRSLVTIMETIGDFKEHQGIDLNILGIVPTLVDSRTNLHSEILTECRRFGKYLDVKVFDTVIPKSIRFATSVKRMKKPATLTNYVDDPLVQSYYELVKEMRL